MFNAKIKIFKFSNRLGWELANHGPCQSVPEDGTLTKIFKYFVQMILITFQNYEPFFNTSKVFKIFEFYVR